MFHDHYRAACRSATSGQKKAPHCGALIHSTLEGLHPSCHGGYINLWLRDLALPAHVVENLGGHLLARAAARGDTKLRLQRPEVRRTGLSSPADVLIGDRIADADVHKSTT